MLSLRMSTIEPLRRMFTKEIYLTLMYLALANGYNGQSNTKWFSSSTTLQRLHKIFLSLPNVLLKQEAAIGNTPRRNLIRQSRKHFLSIKSKYFSHSKTGLNNRCATFHTPSHHILTKSIKSQKRKSLSPYLHACTL